MGGLTQVLVQLLQTGFAVIIALYEDPALADGDPAVDALYFYCQSGGTSTEWHTCAW